MPRRRTIPGLHMRHRIEERRLVHEALERNGWSLTATARELTVTLPRLQRLIKAHGLEQEYEAKAPGPGRPRLHDIIGKVSERIGGADQALDILRKLGK